MVGGGVLLFQSQEPTESEDKRLSNFRKYFTSIKYPLITTIICTNVVVYFLAKNPFVLQRHFILSMRNIREGRYYTLLTSAFAHSGELHLFANMYVLYTFSDIEWRLGESRFAALYIGSALTGSIGSLLMKRLLSLEKGSLGASAAIYGIVGSYALLSPDARFQIIFLPFINFKATDGITYAALFETVGLFFSHVSPLDHAGHLGGLVGGILMFWLMALSDDKIKIVEFEHNGARYKGQVTAYNTKHGQGELTFLYPNGVRVICRGTFKKDNFVFGSKSVVNAHNEDVVELKGTFNRYRLIMGVREDKDTICEGSFDEKERLHGNNGVLKYKEYGLTLKGNWVHGNMVGTGEVIFPDGTKFVSQNFGNLDPIKGDFISPDGRIIPGEISKSSLLVKSVQR